MSEEAKAVQEVAKATSRAIDAGTDMGSFVGRFISGPIEVSMGILSDRLEYVRWERRQRLIRRAELFAAESGLGATMEPMPLNVAVPLLTAATLEENDYLQDEWAKLFISSVDGRRDRSFQKSFVSILQELTELDARVLRAIVECPPERTSGGFVATSLLPDDYAEPRRTKEAPRAMARNDVVIALYNLLRLGLVDRSAFDHIAFYVALPTPLARAFVRACTLPSPI